MIFTWPNNGEFVAKAKKVDYAYVKNWGKCSGALSYAKGAYAAGFKWFKTNKKVREWTKLPDFKIKSNAAGRKTNIKFLHCLRDGQYPDASDSTPMTDCEHENVNEIEMYFKFDRKQPKIVWYEYQDAKSKKNYYYEPKSEETVWVAPTGEENVVKDGKTNKVVQIVI